MSGKNVLSLVVVELAALDQMVDQLFGSASLVQSAAPSAGVLVAVGLVLELFASAKVLHDQWVWRATHADGRPPVVGVKCSV